MKRMRMVGTGLLGALAISMALAVAASAGEYNLKMLPEVGRCVKVGRGAGGEFRRGGCVQSEATGTWQWRSGPGAKPKFTGTAHAAFKLNPQNTGSNGPVSCNTVEVAGEYTGPKNLKTTLTFKGCTALGETSCQNKAGSPEGQITSEELLGELGRISQVKSRAGWNLKPATGSNLASFECGAKIVAGTSTGGGITRELQGSVIGRVEKVNRMLAEIRLIFALKHGVQSPERFEGGVKDTLTMLIGEKLPGTGKTSHATTFEARVPLRGEEALEVLGKCTGTGC